MERKLVSVSYKPVITIFPLTNVDTYPLSKTGRWVKAAEQEVCWMRLWTLLRNPYWERCHLPLHFENVRQTQHVYSDTCFWDRVSHWPGTHHLGQSVGQARPRNPGSTSPELGLKALPCPTFLLLLWWWWRWWIATSVFLKMSYMYIMKYDLIYLSFFLKSSIPTNFKFLVLW